MEFYHNNMSVCAQKVRLVLAEKRLKPIEHHMTLRNGDVHTPEYLALNPKGVVPTLIDNGVVINESTIICEYLEEAYPDYQMRPNDPVARARMREWTQLPDADLHTACGIVSIAVAWRHQILASGGAQLTNQPNQTGKATEFRKYVEEGMENARFGSSVKIYDAAIAKMAKALTDGQWLAGDTYSLADAAMLPYVCRLEDLSFSWLWDGERAVVGRWLERSKARPNFSGIADYYQVSYGELMTEKGREATGRLKQILGYS